MNTYCPSCQWHDDLWHQSDEDSPWGTRPAADSSGPGCSVSSEPSPPGRSPGKPGSPGSECLPGADWWPGNQTVGFIWGFSPDLCWLVHSKQIPASLTLLKHQKYLSVKILQDSRMSAQRDQLDQTLVSRRSKEVFQRFPRTACWWLIPTQTQDTFFLKCPVFLGSNYHPSYLIDFPLNVITILHNDQFLLKNTIEAMDVKKYGPS